MLGSNYLTFENVALPNPVSFAISDTNLESVSTSVAGTDMGIVTRLQKRTISCTFNCTSFWLDKIKTLCMLTQGSLIYRGETIVCRARITGETLVADSEYADRTSGLWTVAVQFLEV